MKKLFLKGDNKNIPTLYWEMIFVELTRPLLFSCLDESGNRYICSCHRADGELCEWIVVPTTCERLIDLLTDQVTIRQIFDADEKQGFLVTLCAGEDAPTARAVEVKELPPEILPTAGCYMEADPGEFDEEIAKLKDAMEVTTSTEESAFYFSSYTIPVSFHIPIIENLNSRAFRQKKLDSRKIAVGACVPI